jgi:hypothetical protein
VTSVPAKGYVASAPELRQPVVAVSLGSLRRRIEALMLPDDLRVVLQLDRSAQRERNRRRQQAQTASALRTSATRAVRRVAAVVADRQERGALAARRRGQDRGWPAPRPRSLLDGASLVPIVGVGDAIGCGSAA